MPSDQSNRRILAVENEVKKLRGEINRLTSEVSTIRQQNETSVAPQQAPDHKHDATQRKPSLPPQIPPTPADSKQANKSWYKTLQGWKTLFEMVAIPFAIAYAVVTGFEWRDLKHNFDKEQRSWVKIAYSWPPLTTNQDIAMNGVLINVGKSPVRYLFAEGVVEIVDVMGTPSFNFKQRHTTHNDMVLFPSDTSAMSLPLWDQQTKKPRPFTPEEISSLQAGRSYLAAFGDMIYADEFGVHWYRFCSYTTYLPGLYVDNPYPCVYWNRMGDGKIPKDFFSPPIAENK